MKRSFNRVLGETNCAADVSLLRNPVQQDPSYDNIWAFTGGGLIYGNGAADWASVRPLAILGQSRKPAFSLWGDSRVCGIGDTFDGACDDRGEVERSIGPAYAYINLAVPGEPLADLSALLVQFPSLVPHLALGQYTTNLIEDLGGADCINYAHPPSGQVPLTISEVQSIVTANKLALWNSWISQLRYEPSSLSTLTLPPHPDAAANANIKAVVDTLRASLTLPNSSGHQIPVRVLDVASVVAAIDGSGQYVWSCPGYTADHVHESQAGCLAIAESGIIDPYALTR
jgi:hypothetical protein